MLLKRAKSVFKLWNVLSISLIAYVGNDEIEPQMWNQMSYDPRSYEHNFSNCVWKPEKFRTSTGLEPVSRGHGFKHFVHAVGWIWISLAVRRAGYCSNQVYQ